ncbi:MAG: hypothetical protein AAFQ95_17350 [Cyanobacteria bacterium J06621_3]
MEPSTDEITRRDPEQVDAAAEISADISEQLKAQVNTLEDAAIAAENSEIKARIRHLIKLIKTNLQSRTLDPKTQKELARLLSLTPTLDHRHSQQLNLLDLAVSMLLEPDNATRTEGNATAAQTAAKNLVFVQETRRQIAQQSRTYPDLFKTIFITGEGTPYIRLISGLSWFFFLFVMVPLTVAGITFAARDIAGFYTTRDYNEQLEIRNQRLTKQINDQQASIESLTQRRNTLSSQLGETGAQIAELIPANSEVAVIDSETATETDADDTPETIQISPAELTSINEEINRTLSSDVKQENELNPADEQANNSPEEVIVSSGGTNSPQLEGNQSLETSVNGLLESADRIFNTSFSLILLAIAMGALGSTISVIVRANTFIQQAQKNENDLFLTGFFRPFVGMSFAIFCVALVEAGIFSGIFDLSGRKDADRAYFYVAIAFVAGFSERLVRDVVVKTEDTLAGPPSQ